MKNSNTLLTPTIIWTIFVIGLGGFTRLMDAGLGCPDWPGCYGHWIVQQSDIVPFFSIQAYIQAWIEMIHRYAAGLLGLGIIYQAYDQWKARQKIKSFFLVALLGFQAALGMWTVTMKLHPLIVSLHFLGGLSILITLLSLQKNVPHSFELHHSEADILWLVRVTNITYFLQIILGLFVSTNYAALSCDMPFFCSMASWQSSLVALEKISLLPWSADPLDWLNQTEKASLQWLHHLNALVFLISYLSLRQKIWSSSENHYLRKSVIDLGLLIVLLQLSLGFILVIFKLPLWAAVLHNIGAVCLGLCLTLITFSFRRAAYVYQILAT